MMGRGNVITVIVSDDMNTISVTDNGAGVPHGKNKDSDEVLIELFTGAHTSGKFNSDNYKKVRGCNGIGTSAVCVCSDFFRVETKREGKEYALVFNDGIPAREQAEYIEDTDTTGSTFIFCPSKEVFHINKDTPNFDIDRIKKELELTSYFIPNVKFIY
jgi:topoisomerase IV subunit B